MENIKLRSMTSLYLVREDAVLCLYRIGSRVANRKFVGAAGGHFEKAELDDPRACVLRELREELGLTVDDLTDLRLRYITHRYVNGEIRQNYYFFAQLKEEKDLVSTEGELQWIPFEKIPELEMPISAGHMMRHYLETGRFQDQLYAGITQENGTVFVPLEDFEG